MGVPIEGVSQAPPPAPQPGTGINATVQQMLQRMLQPRLGGAPGAGSDPQQAPQPPKEDQIVPGKGKNAFQQEMAQKVSNDIMKGVENAVKMDKQKKINEATAQWQTLQAAHERLTMMGKADPQTGQVDLMQDPMAAAILGDPKKMKQMAKAFNVDFLNPEKSNVYADGLKKAIMLDKSGKMLKAAKAFKDQALNKQVGGDIGKKVEGMISPTGGGGSMGGLGAKTLLGDAMKQSLEDQKEAAALAKQEAMQKAQDDRQDKAIAAADERQQKALTSMGERQDKSLLAHTNALKDMQDRSDARMFARLDRMGETKGYIIGDKAVKKYNIAQDQDVPDKWISEKDAEALSTPTQQGRNRAEASGVVQSLMPEMERMIAKLDDKKLGAVAGRITDFKAGKVGMNDPDYIYLNQLSELAKSATAMMHLGLRGAASSVTRGNKFLEAFDTGKMSPDNIRSGIAAVKILTKEYVEEGAIAPIGSPEWNKRYKAAMEAPDTDKPEDTSAWTPVKKN